MIEEHLPLITQQQEEVLDKEQVGFLAEEAPDNVKTMLRSKGYFNSKVSLTEKTAATQYISYPARASKSAMSASPSSATSFQTATLPNTTATPCQTGSSRWAAILIRTTGKAAKTSVLSAVTRKGYPLAKLGNTQATVNPDTATADLNVIVDSNRPILFGNFEITGTQSLP